MMAAATVRSRINGSSSAGLGYPILEWSKVVRVAFKNLMGQARSDSELLAATRIRTWKERHIYIEFVKQP